MFLLASHNTRESYPDYQKPKPQTSTPFAMSIPKFSRCAVEAAASTHRCAPDHDADFWCRHGKESTVGVDTEQLGGEVLINAGQV